MRNINDFITNTVSFERSRYKAAIIGSNPSKGARSPQLWNKFFAGINIDLFMHPLDTNLSNLPSLLEFLSEDASFVGAAVAFPFKENVADYLYPSLSPLSSRCSSVNCIYRDDSGDLIGTNTDGEAAVLSILNHLKITTLDDKQILVLGTGGAAKSVISQLLDPLLNVSSIHVAYNSNPLSDSFLAKNSISRQINFSCLTPSDLNVDIIINCTKVGHESFMPTSKPLSSALLNSVPGNALIFDIIYQPIMTPLLSFALANNIDFLNGLSMNSLQAEIAISNVLPSVTSKHFSLTDISLILNA